MNTIRKVSKKKELDHGTDVFNMRKLNYCDIYGLRSYQGKGKYSVCLHRTLDGTLVLRNNLIKPLIDLFEKEFKACLVRRKEHQDQILNIRFPDKTSNYYLDYLDICDEEGMIFTAINTIKYFFHFVY